MLCKIKSPCNFLGSSISHHKNIYLRMNNSGDRFYSSQDKVYSAW